MNILIVNRAMGTLFGGGESFDFNAARYLLKRGHRVTVVTGKPIWGRPNNTFTELEVIYLPSPELRRLAYSSEKLNSKVSAAFYHLDNLLFERSVFRWLTGLPRDRFDVVQCCSLFRLPAWLLKRCGPPVVSWLPGPPSSLVRSQLLRLRRCQRFTVFTHGSPKWELDEMGFVCGRDYEIIEPGVELERIDNITVDRHELRSRLEIKADELLGVTTARLVPVKNHDLLFKAIALAKAHGVTWHWLIIGDGPLEQKLKRQVDALHLSGQIRFLGYQPQDEVHRWLAVADLFALTSSYENFSIATLEAMAHRLPVIGTPVGYLQQLIRDANAGMVVAALKPEPLAEALLAMAASELRARFGAQGRAFVERLDWQLIANKLENLYMRVTGVTQ